MSFLRTCALAALLGGPIASATPDAGKATVASAPGPSDLKRPALAAPAPAAKATPAEDLEVIENLELLEQLDAMKDLDLLEELAKEP